MHAATGHHSSAHPDVRDELGQGVSEVGVMSEHMTGEERRDGGAVGSCIEHQDQDANV